MKVDEKFKVMSGRVTTDFYHRVVKLAESKNMTTSQFVVMAVKKEMGEA